GAGSAAGCHAGPLGPAPCAADPLRSWNSVRGVHAVERTRRLLPRGAAEDVVHEIAESEAALLQGRGTLRVRICAAPGRRCEKRRLCPPALPLLWQPAKLGVRL